MGDEILRRTARVSTSAGTIRILTPTQCVMDRLAAFYHGNDRQGLEQALMVAVRHEVDRAAMESWSKREGHATGFEAFTRRLDESSRS